MSEIETPTRFIAKPIKNIVKPMAPPPAPSTEPRDVVMNDEFGDGCRVSDDEEGGTRIGDIYIPPPVEPYCSIESKGPRLIITNIVIENFKSYAGKVELGPFHHCTSSIIGPNGSGKSNVIDAMLFVFGYRAQKLRLKKLSFLIHKSSRTNEKNFCSVYVYFTEILDEENGTYKEIPDTKFMISRTAYSDNSSYYSVDGKKMHFKEVAKILKKQGIDLDHNRFLILQGEVESIAMMKPKAAVPNECGFLEYLEDIIGTSRYIEPLQKINDRVEYLNIERTEKHNRCKISEREMKDLKKPYDEAIDYLKLENQNTRIKNLVFQKILSDLQKKVDEIDKDRGIIQGRIDEENEAFSQIKETKLEKEKLIKEEMKKFEGLIKLKEDLEVKQRNAENKTAQLQTSVVTANARRKQTMTNIEKEKEKLEALEKIPDKNRKDIDEANTKISSLHTKKTSQEELLAENLANLKEETKDLIEKKESLQTQLIGLKKSVDASKSDLKVAKSELEMYQYGQKSENEKLHCFKTFLRECQETIVERKQEIDENEKELITLQTNFENAQKKMQELLDEEKELTTQLQRLKAEIEESSSSMQTYKSNNRVLQSLMQQKQSGNIPGILGRLGDLGGIDLKYDVAISTCCGRLDNIVVDTVNTAQACIEHLKRHNVGRATFVALEKIQHLKDKCNSRIQTPENVPRLFDLIKVEDERVRPAFYFALYDTLVTENLQQGTKIAFGARRYRVVTLKGDVIETSGTMSGGGRTLMRGRMGQKVTTKTSVQRNSMSKESIDALRQHAQQLSERISYNQELQSQLEKEIAPMKTEFRIKSGHIKKIKTEYESNVKQQPRFEQQVLQQEKVVANCKTDPKKIKELEQIIANNEKVFQESEANAKKISSQVEKITKQIAEITHNKIKAVETTIKKLEAEIVNLNTYVSKLSVEINTSARNCKKAVDKIESLQAELERIQETMKTESSLRDELQKVAEESGKQVLELKTEIETAQKGSSDIKKEIAEIEKRENEIKLKKIELEETLKGIDKKMTDTKNQMPGARKQLEPLKLNNIPKESAEEPLKVYTEQELEKHKLQDLQYQISVMEESLNAKKPNLSIIEEYEAKREKYLERVALLEDITTKRNEMRTLYEDVRKKRFNEFMQGFHIISKKVKEMYQAITMGGDAELELADSMDPFNEGIIFSVRPPKKSWKQISNLSGGEKTLTSLSLVFALHYYKPSPLYIMDEIDAALDFKNVSIIANYIKQRAKNAQFIIISLRSNMFELCDVLVGIYKIFDCSASVAIENIPPAFITSSMRERGTLKETNDNISMSDNNTTTTSQRINSHVETMEVDQENMPLSQSSVFNTNTLHNESSMILNMSSID